jgi:hypothetical protein
VRGVTRAPDPAHSQRWGGRDAKKPLTKVRPGIVVEVSADTDADASGRWRHPVRLLRPRPDLDPADTPRFGAGNEPATA